MATERGGTPARAGDLVSSLLGGSLGRELSQAAQAARAWYAANGDRERAHTTGVWLNKPPRAGADPVLVVAVDSGLFASELGTNKDLYLTRLAHRGVRVSDIRFAVRRFTGNTARSTGRAGVTPGATGARLAPQADAEATSLSPAELARVEHATANLPDGLRQSAARAMRASLARAKEE